jgi:NAD(P)-dependent dehydrogenase (short-subunit alcohol dehydrogenase family)
VPPISTLYRTAFITGASTGLGRAFAEMLLAEGVKVWGTARDLTRLAALEARAGFRGVELDLEKPDGAEAAFASAAAEAGGSFDLVINNAGYGIFAPFAAVDHAVWQTQIDAMLGTTSRLTQAALRGMATRNRGCIVNVSSLATDFPLPFMSGYNVVKAGLSALTESLIFETRGTGVVVIDFRPGDLRTGFNRAMQPKSTFDAAGERARLDRVWQTLEKNLNTAPVPSYAVKALRKAIRRRKSGTVRCGAFFQAQLAPFLVRFSPAWLRRAIMARYFGIS